jgi:hypothetical protein
MSATLETDNISIFIGGRMDAPIAKQRQQAERAYERWRRSVGMTRQIAAKLKELELRWWKTPSGEQLLRIEKVKGAYRKLQKGRPNQEFLLRLERALYSNDPHEQSAALRLWKEITIPFKRRIGRTKLIPDRKEIRAEARLWMKAGEKKTDVVRAISGRTGAKPSYILRILEDRQ